MKKHSLSRISTFLLVLFSAVVVFQSCGDDLEGTFLINKEASVFKTDTTVYSFAMIDSYGITDEFYQSSIWYSTHNYMSDWGDKAWYESYGVAYESALNNYFFMIVLRADMDRSKMEVEWNQMDRFNYSFGVIDLDYNGGPGIKVSLYDTLTVNGVLYHNIMEFDLRMSASKIGRNTPIKTWISGSIGLIMFERKNGVVSKRVQ